MALTPRNVEFFTRPAHFRRWLEANHQAAPELWVGFHKRESGRPSITWPESVDEALCFGWIDGIRKRLDDESYVIRFTPRKRRSTWSAVNIKRVGELKREGRMTPAGLAAFERRADDKSAIYSYEQRKTATLDEAAERQFRANKEAWEFFRSQPPWYRRTAIYKVISAKKDETRQKRLATLIADSAAGRRIRELDR
ncbi:MAG TPA: YdeI/OmpD-associated family protein [Chthoniobacterales bacterium]|nr:YdeI/OmpD-associated family protein [Chthoniobacterales bacterium]